MAGIRAVSASQKSAGPRQVGGPGEVVRRAGIIWAGGLPRGSRSVQRAQTRFSAPVCGRR
jgi:hypothetical protein